jgi:anti-anti-sigma regulatory factor
MRPLSMVEHKVEPMLKITLHDTAGPLRLELEGRLAGAWVCEVEQCWHTAKARYPNRTLAIDLTGVTFIDQAGRYLLRLMHRDGVSFVASGLMMQDILDHIMDAME